MNQSQTAALPIIEQARKFKQAGQLQQALSCYQKAFAIADNIPAAWYNYGNLLGQLNRAEDAISAYQKAQGYFILKRAIIC